MGGEPIRRIPVGQVEDCVGFARIIVGMAVIGLACRYSIVRSLLPEEFSGGDAPGQANFVLRKLELARTCIAGQINWQRSPSTAFLSTNDRRCSRVPAPRYPVRSGLENPASP